jgi:DNA (cytosine-5)-methyltransferase 1
MRLLDLFCGAGGAAMGYAQAGFVEIVGVDTRPQPRYPFRFVQGDALEYLRCWGSEYDVIHASPPCQGYSRLRHLPWLKDKRYPLLLEPLHDLLAALGKPWVIENVETAPLDGVVLCGASLGLRVYRHRRFASNLLLLAPAHRQHTAVIGHGRGLNRLRTMPRSLGYISVAGHQAFSRTEARTAMEIDWMTLAELTQAIPPAYTRWVGAQLLKALTP